MKLSDLIFIGIKGSVVALNQHTGEQAWATQLKGSDFVNILMLENKLLASCCGEIFCLEPLTGEALWHNPLKGFGRGLATMVSECSLNGATVVSAAKRRQDEAAAATAVAAA